MAERKSIYKIFDVLLAISIGFLLTMLFLYNVSRLENPSVIDPLVFWSSIIIFQFILPYKFIDIWWRSYNKKWTH